MNVGAVKLKKCAIFYSRLSKTLILHQREIRYIVINSSFLEVEVPVCCEQGGRDAKGKGLSLYLSVPTYC